MYDYIKGKVAFKGINYLVVENNSIGYKIHSSLSTYHQIKLEDEVTIYIYFQVKENEQTFYGFSDKYERDVFSAIMSVSGIGPKLGLKVLAEIKADKLITAIANQDIELLKKVKGLGEKTVGKMVLDLNNKINHLLYSGIKVENKSSNNVYNQTLEALKTLGYKDGEIKKVLALTFDGEVLNLEEAVKKTLKALSKV